MGLYSYEDKGVMMGVNNIVADKWESIAVMSKDTFDTVFSSIVFVPVQYEELKIDIENNYVYFPNDEKITYKIYTRAIDMLKTFGYFAKGLLEILMSENYIAFKFPSVKHAGGNYMIIKTYQE